MKDHTMQLMDRVSIPSQTKFILFVFFYCLTCILVSCSEPLPAEKQLLENLQSAKLSLEALNANELNEWLAADFDINGKGEVYDFQKIKRMMLGYRLRKQKINVFLSGNTVTLNPHNTQLASIKSSALVTGGKDLIPEDGRIYQVETHWRLYDDEWKIIKVKWQ